MEDLKVFSVHLVYFNYLGYIDQTVDRVLLALLKGCKILLLLLLTREGVLFCDAGLTAVSLRLGRCLYEYFRPFINRLIDYLNSLWQELLKILLVSPVIR